MKRHQSQSSNGYRYADLWTLCFAVPSEFGCRQGELLDKGSDLLPVIHNLLPQTLCYSPSEVVNRYL